MGGSLAALREAVICVLRLLEVVVGAAEPMEKGDNLSPVSFSRDAPEESLVPMALCFVVAFAYSGAIEYIGWLVASAIGIGRGRATPRKYAKQERFVASWLEMVYFSLEVFVSYRLFGKTEWFWPTGWFANEGGGDCCNVMKDGYNQEIPGLQAWHAPRELKAFYLLEMGYYMSQIVKVLSRRRKKDFVEMIAHHVITIWLISVSYLTGYLRIGIVVMVLHALFDPFLHAAKCVHYAVKKSSPVHILADIFFAMCAVVFLASRLILYPIAIAATFFGGVYTFDENLLRFLLACLYPIHIFWFYLILKVLHAALIGGTVQQDNRSDDEDSEGDDAADAATAKKDM